MKSTSVRITFFLVCLFMLSISLPGCGSGSSPESMLANASDNNVKRVSRMYTVYQMRHGMVGPKDEAELKEFILEHSASRLARIGIEPESVDDIFSSERDGQKLVVRYGLKLEGPNCSIPVVFESDGVSGTRLVGFANDYTVEISDDSEYERLLSGDDDNRVIDEIPADENQS